MAVADQALQDSLDWLNKEGDVAILDATNTTRERRQLIYETVVLKNGIKCLFLGKLSFSDGPRIVCLKMILLKRFYWKILQKIEERSSRLIFVIIIAGQGHNHIHCAYLTLA